MAGTSVSDKAIFAGGWDYCTNVYGNVDIFDSTNSTWIATNLSQPRWNLAAASAGSKALFAGGATSSSCQEIVPSNVVDIYDSATNSWSTATLSEARTGLTAVSVGSKIFFAGGATSISSGSNSTRIDIYDTTSNSWTINELPRARSAHSAVVNGNKIYFASGSPVTSSVDILNVDTGTWSSLDYSILRWYVMGIAHSGNLYFAGGSYQNHYSKIDIFNILSGTWNNVEMSRKRSQGASAANLRHAFFGFGTESGPDVTDSSPASIDIFDESGALTTTLFSSGRRRALGVATIGNLTLFGGGIPDVSMYGASIVNGILDLKVLEQ